MTTQIDRNELWQMARDYLPPNYGDRSILLVRGEGARVWDDQGKEYLDFLSGISVNNLGHCHPAVTAAVQKQVAEFVHCSNLYLIEPQIRLAKRLCELSFAEQVFFANSGAEANEAALKLARRWSKRHFGPGRHEVITFENSFHGRTMAMISATAQAKVQKDYEPLLEGFRYARLNDLDSVMAVLSERTCAIMLEPLQGEGGITPAETPFLQSLRALCDERKILLIFDEVQCGMGRVGTLFDYQFSGVVPDILVLAKALGNGIPIGAMLTTKSVAQVLEPGSHGSTFGGNPLACAAALAVLQVMVDERIPERSARLGRFFGGELCERIGAWPIIRQIRGRGLMVGIELEFEGAGVVRRCQENGLLLNCTMGRVLRILPPLIVSEDECRRAAEILEEAILHEWKSLPADHAALALGPIPESLGTLTHLGA
jgi:predicted acetylornithine/succinylornithine family transaminase